MSDEPFLKEAESGLKTNTKKISNPVKSILTIILFLLWIAIMLVALLFYKIFNAKNIHQFYMLFHKGACRIFSIRYKVYGSISKYKPTLFLSNHISYLDVIILGAHIPGQFIAKSEVAGWPLMGFLAKLQNTLFFERHKSKVQNQLDAMSQEFDQHKNLILFPEGTSTDGEGVQSFKSSLLKSVELTKENVLIQPVTICYSSYKQNKMNKPVRDHYAWYGSMPFAPHFFSAAGLGSSEVEIIFHPPQSIADFSTRKDCAQHCHSLVSDALKECLQK